MDCSEDIYAFEHNYQQTKYYMNEQINQANDQVLKELNWKSHIAAIGALPKIHIMNYPVSTFVLPS